MGLPFWEMPDRLAVGGVSYPINTDFRVGIRIRQMFWEPYYQTHQVQLMDGIRRLLFSCADAGIGQETELLCAVLWYLMDGRMSEQRILRRLNGAGTDPSESVPGSGTDTVFSYLWDMPAVYASFLAAYRMDLLTAEMHLWQFDALFAALPDDCVLRRTMALRVMPIDSAEDDGTRAVLAAQKLAVRVPAVDMLYEDCLLPNGSSFCCSFAKKKEKNVGELLCAETVGQMSAEGDREENGCGAVSSDSTTAQS